jgi:hypothetical protein
MGDEPATRQSSKPQQSEHGRWDCRKCSQTFITRKIARVHFRNNHNHGQEPTDEATKTDQPREVTRVADAKGKVYKVRCKKNGRWPCPQSCGRNYLRPEHLGVHLRKGACEKRPKIVPKKDPPLPFPVVSMRLQMKRLASNADDERELSSSILDIPENQKERPRFIRVRRPSDITDKHSNRTNPKDTMSSIIVTRDEVTSEIKRIDFKDARDTLQPDLTQMYPQCKDTRSRVRCGRAILCNDAVISDEHAPPTNDPYSLLPILFRNLSKPKIMEHARSNYFGATDELELFKEEGLRLITQYLDPERDSSTVPSERITSPTTLASDESHYPKEKTSKVGVSSQRSDTPMSHSEQYDFTTSPLESPLLNQSTGSSVAIKRRHSTFLQDEYEESKPKSKKKRKEHFENQCQRLLSNSSTTEVDGIHILFLQLTE